MVWIPYHQAVWRFLLGSFRQTKQKYKKQFISKHHKHTLFFKCIHKTLPWIMQCSNLEKGDWRYMFPDPDKLEVNIAICFGLQMGEQTVLLRRHLVMHWSLICLILPIISSIWNRIKSKIYRQAWWLLPTWGRVFTLVDFTKKVYNVYFFCIEMNFRVKTHYITVNKQELKVINC